MNRPANYKPIAYSERAAPSGSEYIRRVDPDTRLNVTVYVRRNPDAPDLPGPEEMGVEAPLARAALGMDEFALRYGARPDDLQAVAAFAQARGLHAAAPDIATRSIRLTGRAADFERAFGVTLEDVQLDGRLFRIRTGAIYVPPELGSIVEAVLGLDNRSVGAPRLRQAAAPPAALTQATLASARALLPPGTFFPTDVARLYRYPQGTSGAGECIAILAFNGPQHGGYRIDALRTYFEQILQVPMPDIKDVVVLGPGNDPGSDSPAAQAAGDSTAEIMLDIQVAGSVAPGARLVLYFTEFTEQGWVDVLNAVITDTANRPSIISISYGNPEDDPRSAWTRMAILKATEAMRAAAARRFTICCASGDDGSRDQASGMRAHADFPASCPFVLGCGGTRVTASGNSIADEVVWNDGPGSATGGGISRFFPLPSWQADANVPPSANPDKRIGRGVPDVAGTADPATGVAIITADGNYLAIAGGTSVTAPLWSALIARLNEALGGRLGFVNPLFYKRFGTGVFRDVTRGNNGAYSAGPGWDACTGLGSPDGLRLLRALRSLSHAAGPPIDARQRAYAAYMKFAWTVANNWTRPDARRRLGAAYQQYAYALSRVPASLLNVDRVVRQAYVDLAAAIDFALSPGVADQPVRAALDDLFETVQDTWRDMDTYDLDPDSIAAVTQILNTAAVQSSAAVAGIRQRWLALKWAQSSSVGLGPFRL